MELGATSLNKLNEAAPGAVLEHVSFGRSRERDTIWVEARHLALAAATLAREAGIELDWLENLSVIQQEEALIATYFLRSTRLGHALVLRASVEPGSASREAELRSVTPVWAMAAPFEIEAGELFGIRFVLADGAAAHPPGQRLPQGWNGYPLRKSYMFPTEFLGIPHSRKGGGERS